MKKELFSPLSDLEYKLYDHVWDAWKTFFKENAPDEYVDKLDRRLALNRFVEAVCQHSYGREVKLALPPVGSVVDLTLNLAELSTVCPELLACLYAPEFALEHEAALAAFITLKSQRSETSEGLDKQPCKAQRTVSYCSSSCKSSCRHKCGSYARRLKKLTKRRRR